MAQAYTSDGFFIKLHRPYPGFDADHDTETDDGAACWCKPLIIPAENTIVLNDYLFSMGPYQPDRDTIDNRPAVPILPNGGNS